MNVLLGLPVGRVKRIGLLSIFFIMHLLISIAGGAAGTLFTFHVLYGGPSSEWPAMRLSLVVGALISLVLVLLYILTVLYTTAEGKLGDAGK